MLELEVSQGLLVGVVRGVIDRLMQAAALVLVGLQIEESLAKVDSSLLLLLPLSTCSALDSVLLDE